MVTVGVDVGSAAAKAVVFNGKIVSIAIRPTGWSPRETGRKVFEEALAKAGIAREEVHRVIGTGYGRVSLDFIDKAVTEITCHALGANYYFPRSNLIIDIGGQDSKAILVDGQGRVLNFVMNDKCAAGTGRFLQIMAQSLGLELAGLVGMALAEPVAISSMCTVFAESEVISLLASGVPKERIITGIYHSVAQRVANMAAGLGQALGVVFTGGVAMNPGIREVLSKAVGTEVMVPDNPQIIGALGAALLGISCHEIAPAGQ